MHKIDPSVRTWTPQSLTLIQIQFPFELWIPAAVYLRTIQCVYIRHTFIPCNRPFAMLFTLSNGERQNRNFIDTLFHCVFHTLKVKTCVTNPVIRSFFYNLFYLLADVCRNKHDPRDGIWPVSCGWIIFTDNEIIYTSLYSKSDRVCWEPLDEPFQITTRIWIQFKF